MHLNKNISAFALCLLTLSSVALSAAEPVSEETAYDLSAMYDPAKKPFYHGVASGDPMSDRVIIWTRVTPEDESSARKIGVAYQVSKDPGLEELAASGTATTSAARDVTTHSRRRIQRRIRPKKPRSPPRPAVRRVRVRFGLRGGFRLDPPVFLAG